MAKSKSPDMTKGNITAQLLLFFFPILLGTFFQQLYNTAIYLLEHGDIIADGHTLTGSNGEPWHCRHEDSLLEPSRLVLDICPNAPYAAGNRDD